MDGINSDILDDLDPSFTIDDDRGLPPFVDTSSTREKLTRLQEAVEEGKELYTNLQDVVTAQESLQREHLICREVVRDLLAVVPDLLSERISLESYTHRPTRVNYDYTVKQLGLKISQESANVSSAIMVFLENASAFISECTPEAYYTLAHSRVSAVLVLKESRKDAIERLLASKDPVLDIPIQSFSHTDAKRPLESLLQSLSEVIRSHGVQTILSYIEGPEPIHRYLDLDISLRDLLSYYISDKITSMHHRTHAVYESMVQEMTAMYQQCQNEINSDVSNALKIQEVITRLETIGHLRMGVEEWILVNYYVDQLIGLLDSESA